MAGPPRKRQRREEKHEGELPQKKFYRQRAHANPFSDHGLEYPAAPEAMDWAELYPAFFEGAGNKTAGDNDTAIVTSNTTLDAHLPAKSDEQPVVRVADIGCGFGGLLFALSPLMPETLILGLEIRSSVTAFVRDKIRALRTQAVAAARKEGGEVAEGWDAKEGQMVSDAAEQETNLDSNSQTSTTAATSTSPPTATPTYANIAVLRANTMKFLPNFFARAQLHKIFLCFPDPHFKARKHKARIVSPALAAEYAYVLAPGGRIYTITDVEDMHLWMVEGLVGCEGFRRVGEEEVEGDACVGVMRRETEEGRKVERNGGVKFVAVFERVVDPGWM